MKVRNFTTVCFRCSHCGNIEKTNLNLFDFSGNYENVIRCQKCERVVCRIGKDTQKKYKLEISCAECGNMHKFCIPVSEFWHTKERCFCCSLTEGVIFAVGTGNRIEKEIDNHSYFDSGDKNTDGYEKNEANHIYDMISSEELSGFEDANEFFECLEHFKFLSEENLISCDCSASDIQLQVEEDGFRIICSRCGREKFFGFSSHEDIDKILGLTEIRLH